MGGEDVILEVGEENGAGPCQIHTSILMKRLRVIRLRAWAEEQEILDGGEFGEGRGGASGWIGF